MDKNEYNLKLSELIMDVVHCGNDSGNKTLSLQEEIAVLGRIRLETVKRAAHAAGDVARAWDKVVDFMENNEPE